MPCYTVSTATVLFGKNTDRELLALAADSLGVRISTFDSASGTVTISGSFRGSETETMAALKRAYSVEVVKQTAKRNGWSLNWSQDAAGNPVANVERISR